MPHNKFIPESINVKFPEAQNPYMNMKQFIVEQSFEQSRIPANLRPCWKNFIWDGHLQRNERTGKEITERHGDIQHLGEYLGGGKLTKPNTVYWITDLTTHEYLPLETATYRQYFRLARQQALLWFDDHSTKNPLTVEPATDITKAVKRSKFGHPSQLKVK